MKIPYAHGYVSAFEQYVEKVDWVKRNIHGGRHHDDPLPPGFDTFQDWVDAKWSDNLVQYLTEAHKNMGKIIDASYREQDKAGKCIEDCRGAIEVLSPYPFAKGIVAGYEAKIAELEAQDFHAHRAYVLNRFDLAVATARKVCPDCWV